MPEHARLAPSAAKRWLSCPGSVALCENTVDYSSEDADHGTACHELLSIAVEGGDARAAVGRKSAVGLVFTEEMAQLVEPVVEWIDDYRHRTGALLFSEQRVEIGEGAFGLRAGLFWGTVDLLGVSKEELLVLDAKFGYVGVPVIRNEQLICYGIGGLEQTGWTHDRVRLVIAQPRSGEPKEHVYTASEMNEFVREFHPKVLEALNGGPLRPSDEACRWCKAQATCPALRGQMVELAKREFSVLATSPEEIGELLDKGEMVESALRAVRAHALRLMEMGTEIPGWKRVLGKKHRTWRDEDDSVTQLKKIAFLYKDEIYEQKVRSPRQVQDLLRDRLYELGARVNVAASYEKITGKPLKKVTKAACDVVAEKMVDLAGAHTPKGEPTLAKASDARPALAPTFTEEDVDPSGLLD